MINIKKFDSVAEAVKGVMQKEALKGDQHKIDKNKNNKIDAHDFAILRGEKKPMKKEETEQVDEVNNPFDLKNYKSQLKSKPGEKAGFDSKKISTGTVYSRKPVKDEPMKKEEVEQIDELKKTTVKSYLKKKMDSLPGKDPKKDQESMMKAHHRVTGVKPTSEEVELDEVYDVEHMRYINTKEGDKHFEDGHATMMKHIGDEFQKVNAKRYAHNAFKENPHEKGTKEYKAWHHGADAARDEHIGGLHEAAKWRSTSIAKKVTDPDDYHDSASYDYHHDNPRSTGMKKATSDTPTKYSSLSARPSVQVASQGARKGMITKQHAERIKARIKAGMNKEEVEQVDERTLTKGETKEKERIVKGMKKSFKGFKQRYGERAKSVMYATATKAAKNEETITEAKRPESDTVPFITNGDSKPLAHAKDLAKKSLKRLKSEMLGKTGTSE